MTRHQRRQAAEDSLPGDRSGRRERHAGAQKWTHMKICSYIRWPGIDRPPGGRVTIVKGGAAMWILGNLLSSSLTILYTIDDNDLKGKRAFVQLDYYSISNLESRQK